MKLVLQLMLLIIVPVFSNSAKDLLSIPGPISFNNSRFELQWSSHPTGTYYKHEYIRSAENTSNYTEMMMIEIIDGDISPKDAFAIKVKELTARKEIDPVCNFDILVADGGDEYILDFVLSDGKSTVEWNLYRYTLQKNKRGNDFLVLMAYSNKEVLEGGDAAKKFFGNIKTSRSKLIAELTKFDIPKVKL